MSSAEHRVADRPSVSEECLLERHTLLRQIGCTPREAQVIGLICQGRSNDDIARELYLSINTVKTYIRGAYRKLDLTRRAEVVLWGTRHGL